MNTPKLAPKSQTELIVEKFVENLENHSEFDNATKEKLKELSDKGNLTKDVLVEKIIEVKSGGTHETS